MATEELSGPPRAGALLARAALGALPLPGSRPRADDLPDVELVLPAVRVDLEHLAAYARVCGFGLGDELPPTYPHVLAFPLAMRLLTDSAFPFPMLGLVHVDNSITQRRPLRLDEAFSLRVRAADLRPHERGRQFDVIQEATVGDELVWRDRSTYLRRSPSTGRRPKDDRPPDGPATAVWQVGDDIGRRYAAVSGDRNPIHLSALTARALGFPRAIAHGMWTKARCIAALQGRLPAGYTVDVAFKVPVLLPTTVTFSAETTAGGGWRFGLREARSGRPHLAGTVTAA